MKAKTITSKVLLSIVATFTIAVTAIVLLLISGYSWFSDTRTVKPQINSSVLGSYFEDGTGTSDDPYIIKRPVQLYYFAWLQDLGAFNTVNDGTISQKYFKISDDVTSINMRGYILPPVGTVTNPFVGNFNGNGKIISNLTVSNTDLTDTPISDNADDLSGYQIVGFFGVIGSTETVADNVDSSTNIIINGTQYTYTASTNSVYNFLLDTCTVSAPSPKNKKILIGIAAGYVSNTLEKVGVYNCSISVGALTTELDANITDKKSAYSLIGYSKTAVDAYGEQHSSTGSDFGGSVAMETLHTNITAINGSNGTGGVGEQKSAHYLETIYAFYDESGNYVDKYVASSSSKTFLIKDFNSTAGTYMLSSSGSFGTTYFYIYGGYKETVSREYYYADSSGYAFIDESGTYYLGYDLTNNSIVTSTESKGWFKNNNTYYVQKNTIPSSNPTTNYYLTRDNYGRLSLSTSSSNWSSSGTSLYYSSQYVVHINGANGGWGLTDSNGVYKIVNNGYYLNYNNATSITSSTDESSATEWLNTNGYIHTVINDTTYYLTYSNSTISLSTNPTTQFTISNNKISYNDNHLVYYKGNWFIGTPYYITDGTNYLNEDLSNTTDISNATEWVLNNNSQIVSFNGTTYLRNDNWSLSTTTNSSLATIWDTSNNKILNGDVYLTYNEGWELSLDGYYIKNGNNYLTYSNGVADTTNQDDALVWYLEGGTSGEGNIYTVINGVQHYLVNDNGTLSISSNAGSPSSWTISNGGIFNSKLYIGYDNGFTLAYSGYRIASVSGNTYNYLTYNGNLTNSTSISATNLWNLSNGASGGTFSIVYNNIKYYLVNTNGILSLSASVSDATEFTISNNKITDGNYYLVYQDGSWKIDYNGYYIYSEISSTKNYLTYSNGFINSTNEESATIWMVEGEGDNTHYYTAIDGVKQYLHNNNGTLSIVDSYNSASSWTYQDNKLTDGDDYVYFNGTNWIVSSEEYYITYTNGNNKYYLTISGGNISKVTNDASSASIWKSVTSGDGYILSTVESSNTYYLVNNNNSLEVTQTEGNASVWTISNGAISNESARLTYDTTQSEWTLATIRYSIQSDNYYLTRSGTSITRSETATYYFFEESTNGTYIYDNSGYYLRNNNGTLSFVSGSSNATEWTVNKNSTTCTIVNGNYYIDYASNNFKLSQFGYYIYDVEDEMYFYMSDTSSTNTNLTGQSNKNNATIWLLGNDGKIYAKNNSSYYLYSYNNYRYRSARLTNSSSDALTYDGTVADQETGSIYFESSSWWGGTTYYYPYYYNNNYFRLGDGSSYQRTFRLDIQDATSFNITEHSNAVDVYTERYEPGNISEEEYTPGENITLNYYEFQKTNSFVSNLDTPGYLSSASYQSYESTTGTITRSSITVKELTYRTSNFQYADSSQHTSYHVDYQNTYASYFPINSDKDNNYEAINSNTGYIVSGSGSSSNYKGGDIRISKYMKGVEDWTRDDDKYYYNVSYSLDNTGLSIDTSKVYTINNNGNVTIQSILNNGGSFYRYDAAKSGYEEILSQSEQKDYVFGLHFMQSNINIDNLVNAKHVLINGQSYDNYDLPADCIDFNLSTKGYINFIAGTFFYGNNSFFTLHKIYRNVDKAITDIKEIAYIYGTSNESEVNYKKYIYVFSDETMEYSDGTAVDNLPSNYELKFDTAWIKQNTFYSEDTSSGNETYHYCPLYYFEIPMDAGEYALGSVPGANGAYLLYLDIAANAGDTENEVMSYISGVDWLTAADVSLLDGIDKPVAALALRLAFSYTNSDSITITRTDQVTNGVTHVTLTVTSTTDQSETTRYYVAQRDNYEIEVVYRVSSDSGG